MGFLKIGRHKSNAADLEQPAATSATAAAGAIAAAPAASGAAAGSAAPAAAQQQAIQLVHASEPSAPERIPSKTPQIEGLNEAQRKTLEHVQLLSKYLDTAVKVPGTNFSVGADALIGLVPGAGDVVGACMGTYLVSIALKYHLPKRLVLRMMANQCLDMVVGIIPFFGDIFDVVHKANAKNTALLMRHLESPKASRKAARADGCFLFGLFLLVVVLPIFLVCAIIGGIIALIVVLVKH